MYALKIFKGFFPFSSGDNRNIQKVFVNGEDVLQRKVPDVCPKA